MVAAERINFSTIQSPSVALYLVGDSKKSPDPQPKKGFAAALIAFMMAQIEAQVAMVSNESKVNQTQNTVAQSMVASSLDESTKAQTDYKNFTDALYAQQHESWWQQLLGGLGAAFGVILAGLTGGVCSFLVAASIMMLMTVPTDSDGNTTFGKLDQALANAGLPDGLVAVVKMVIVVAATLVGNAAGASAEVGLSMLVNAAKTGAAEAAEVAAGSAAGDAAASAASGAAADPAAAESNSFLSNVAKTGFNRASLLASGTQVMFAVNPFVDMICQFCDWGNASDETKKIVAQTVGALLAIIAAFVADRVSLSGDMTNTTSLRKLMNPTTFKWTHNTLDAVRGGLNVGASVFGILAGMAGLDSANAERKLGNSQGSLTVFQGILAQTNSVIRADQQNFKSLDDTYAMMSNTWEKYVQAYITAADVL